VRKHPHSYIHTHVYTQCVCRRRYKSRLNVSSLSRVCWQPATCCCVCLSFVTPIGDRRRGVGGADRPHETRLIRPVPAFQFADPRSERISAGPRHALRRAQQHHPGGGTEEAVVPEQTTLADEQYRVRRQHTGRAHHTGDRRREALKSQSHRDCRLETMPPRRQ